MGARGRAAQPNVVKLARGNPGKRAINRQEPKPTAGIPPKPTWLKGVAEQLWDELTPHLKQAGLVTLADGVALEGLCWSYSQWLATAKILQHRGRIIKTEGGPMVRPEVGMSLKFYKMLMALSDRFGLSPSARSRLTAAPQGEEEDPFDQFLGKKGKRG